jgi:hypothetical protein
VSERRDNCGRIPTRRQVLQHGAIAGALVWATLVVRSLQLDGNRNGFTPPQSSTTTEHTGPSSSTTTTTRPSGNGCVRTQGYWKNHADPEKHYDTAWDAVGGPDASFFNTGKSYLVVLETEPGGGNAFLILAHQWIAAELNLASGASMSATVQGDLRRSMGVAGQVGVDIRHSEERPGPSASDRARRHARRVQQRKRRNAALPLAPLYQCSIRSREQAHPVSTS